MVILMCKSDSGTNMDDRDSDDYEWVSNTMEVLRSNQNDLVASALVATKYYMTYLDKNEVRTPAQSVFGWTLEELLNTLGESHKMFRMNTSLFDKLHNLLVSTYGLESSIHMNSMELLAIFLLVCGHGMSKSSLHAILKDSTETISQKFDDVLIYLVSMCEDYIRPIVLTSLQHILGLVMVVE